MPATINGIGTHYYGKRDATSRAGTCPHCGADSKLESYTTRLWFVIFFIPIIPLKRVRLLDYCSRCSRHWAVNPDQYEKTRQETITKLLKSYSDQPTIESAFEVHAQMLMFHMNSEANTFREAALAAFADNTDLRLGFASHLEQFGQTKDATPLYEQAFELDSSLPAARMALAARRIDQRELDSAYQLLEFLFQPGSSQKYNLNLLEVLARSYQSQKQHERTLEICEFLLKEIPEAGEHFSFRQLVTKSEQALQRAPSLLPERRFSIRDLFDSKSTTCSPRFRWTVFGTAALLLFVIGMAGTNEYYRTHRTLYVISGFAQPATVSIDGSPAIAVGATRSFALSEGSHQIEITGPFTKHATIEVQSSYWSRWLSRPIWVYNIGNVSSLYEETIHYAINPAPPETRYLSDTELSYVPHVDYPFEDPPQQLKVDNRNQSVKKVHVGLSIIPPVTRFGGLLNSSDNDIALTYAEGFLNLTPNDAMLLMRYSLIGKNELTARRVIDFLKAGLWRTPISTAWHRAYQSLKTDDGERAELAQDYDARLKDDPGNVDLVYLRGRISPTHAEQLQYFRRAHEMSNQTGWPAFALAVDAMNRGEWQEAKPLCDEAMKVIGSDPSVKRLKHFVYLGVGDAAVIEADYKQKLQSSDTVEFTTSIMFLADALAVQAKCDEARKTVHQRLAEMFGAGAPAEMETMFDPILDYTCGNLDGLKSVDHQLIVSGFARVQFDYLLTIADFEKALKIAEANELLGNWNEMLEVSLAYSLSGNSDEADQWRLRACEKMEAEGLEDRVAAKWLKGEQPPSDDELNEITLSIAETPLYLASLAQRFPVRKAELKRRAERVNVSRLPPYLLVKTAIEQP